MISIAFNWFPLISIDFLWFQLISIDFLWFLLISLVFCWFELLSITTTEHLLLLLPFQAHQKYHPTAFGLIMLPIIPWGFPFAHMLRPKWTLCPFRLPSLILFLSLLYLLRLLYLLLPSLPSVPHQQWLGQRSNSISSLNHAARILRESIWSQHSAYLARRPQSEQSQPSSCHNANWIYRNHDHVCPQMMKRAIWRPLQLSPALNQPLSYTKNWL